MDIEGSVAFVTGANRGLGRAFAQGLLDHGAAKVYAGVRDPASVDGTGLTAVRLDVTDPALVTAAAEACGDVSIVVNNAGIAEAALPLASDLDVARAQLEVNYLGTLRVSQAFAPVLAANGGGALVNMLSLVSWVGMSVLATYAASKSAQWSITNSLRVQLRAQGTQVVGVHCGFVDTDLTAGFDADKISPQDVAAQTMRVLAEGGEEVLADDWTRQVKSGLHDDLGLIYPGIQADYDETLSG